MENKINQLMQLANGKRYIVYKQAVYKKENYFVAVEVDEKEEKILDSYKLFHETIENGQAYVKEVTDPSVYELVLKYLKLDKVEE